MCSVELLVAMGSIWLEGERESQKRKAKRRSVLFDAIYVYTKKRDERESWVMGKRSRDAGWVCVRVEMHRKFWRIFLLLLLFGAVSNAARLLILCKV